MDVVADDRQQHVFNVLPQPLVLDVAVQGALFEDRQIAKEAPADPVGDYVAGGHILGVAATAKVRF